MEDCMVCGQQHEAKALQDLANESWLQCLENGHDHRPEFPGDEPQTQGSCVSDWYYAHHDKWFKPDNRRVGG